MRLFAGMLSVDRALMQALQGAEGMKVELCGHDE
jgi:hypothetical protein